MGNASRQIPQRGISFIALGSPPAARRWTSAWSAALIVIFCFYLKIFKIKKTKEQPYWAQASWTQGPIALKLLKQFQ